jgi:hypothetical protein
LSVVVEEMTSCTTTREQSVRRLTELLRGCLSTSSRLGNLRFLSQQIVSDVEEIFDFPFGDVVSDGVKPGNGSKQGHDMLLNGGEIQSSFGSTLSSVVTYIKQNASDEDLAMLGYHRLRRGNKICVVNTVNGRPLNSTDAEHFLCKGWLIAKQTLPRYTVSEKPQASRPNCHPIKNGKKTVQADDVTVVMKEIITTYESSKRQREIPPRFCLMPSERQEKKKGATDVIKNGSNKRQRCSTASPDNSTTSEESL